MAWPADNNPVVGEMLINGAWVDVTSRIRGEDQIRIKRGRGDIQGSSLMPPTVCDFTLNNRDGLFTDDNPLSAYFGLLPLFTDFRLSMPGSGDHYMYLPGHDTINYARTTDKAALDITGDIDIRMDIAPATWNPGHPGTNNGGTLTVLASKTSDPTSSFSWFLGLRTDGKLYFNWAPTGNAFAGLGIVSTVLVPTGDRMAIRFTLDVDNGAGGWTARWYTAPTIDDTWTSFAFQSGTGVTSLFNSTGYVEVGSGWLGGGVYGDTISKTYSGKVYAFQLRNGIDGTLVANADFRTKPYGNANFSDGLGNTWEVRNGAVIAGDDIRFWGEIETLPQEWDPSGKDMFSRVHAQDLIARLNMKQQPVRSPIYNNRIQYDPTGYWTFEDGANSTQGAAASRDTAPAAVSNIIFKAADDLPGSDGVAQFANGGAFVRGRTRLSSITGTASALIFFRFNAIPSSTVTIMSMTTVGSNAQWWRIETDGASFTTRAFDADGNSLLSSAVLVGGISVTKWVGIRLELTTSGGNINWATAWHQVGDPSFLGGSGSIAGTVGRFTGFTVFGSSANTDMYFSHVWIDTSLVDFVNNEFRDSANGYIGEQFGTRFRRICGEAGITPDIEGWEFDTSPVGRQPIDTPIRILQDGADVDGGFLTGSRRASNTLTYITRSRIQSAQKLVTLEHDGSSHLAEPPKPVKDSSYVRNDVTVTRAGGGSSSRVVVTGERYGTAAIGTVPASETYNVAKDTDTQTIAGWLAYLGSSGEYRFPEITVGLHRKQTLMGSTIGKAVTALDLGRYLEVDKLPAGQAPGPYEQLVIGYYEMIHNKLWTVRFNGVPYTMWRAGIIENGTEPIRFADSNTTVNATVTSTATSIVFKTPDTSARWVTLADSPPSNTFPMDVMIGGELIRVSDITGTTAAGGFYTQTATVVRSRNGVVKSQTAGTPVKLRRITRFGR